MVEPIVKQYTNDEDLEYDINKLKQNGVNTNTVYVLSHDPNRAERIVNNTEVLGIDYNRTKLNQSFEKQGDELREKLQEVGLFEKEANEFEEHMDEGKVILIVNDSKASDIL